MALWPSGPAATVLRCALLRRADRRRMCGWAQELYLWNNSLSGSLPTSWALPEGMTTFSMSYNRFSGRLPDTWVLPSSLQYLFLGAYRTAGGSCMWRLCCHPPCVCHAVALVSRSALAKKQYSREHPAQHGISPSTYLNDGCRRESVVGDDPCFA